MDNLVGGLSYFFRGTEDKNFVQSKEVLIVGILICIVVFFISCKKDIKKLNKTFIRIMGFLLFSFQLGITIWFFLVKKELLKEGLPLYFCRISSIVVGFSLMLYKIKGKIVNFFAIFSVFGASIALLVPNMEAYNFPHITTISYMAIHGMLLFESIYLVRTSGVSLSRNTIIKLTIGVVFPIHIVNLVLGSNYAYTVDLPSVLKTIPQQFSAVFIALTTILIVEIVQWCKDRKKGLEDCLVENVTIQKEK